MVEPSREWMDTERIEVVKELIGRMQESVRRQAEPAVYLGTVRYWLELILHVLTKDAAYLEANRETILKANV